MANPCETMEWLAVRFRDDADTNPGEEHHEQDASEVEQARAVFGNMLAALRDIVGACGGNPPDWLREEFAAAENAIAEAEGRHHG